MGHGRDPGPWLGIADNTGRGRIDLSIENRFTSR
jgi:hypothetical protein